MYSFKTTPQCRARAFTLIELLTVIAIIGILAAIIIPTVGAVRRRANATVAMSNLRQMGLAQLMHADENRGMITPGWGYAGEATSWRNRLLPYIAPNTGGMTKGQRDAYVSALRLERNFVMDVPEVNRVGNHDTGVGINEFILTELSTINPRSYLKNVERPATIVMLGERKARNSEKLSNNINAVEGAEFRRDGDKAYMTMCDGRVKLCTREELAKTSAANGSPWRWW